MATYHLTVKAGAKGKAAAHAAYISRDGKYSGRERYEDLEATGAGNLPKWAEHNPTHFWQASDQHERANGTAYREIEIALPRELTPDQRRELVEQFVQQELGDRHAYQWAIHKPKAALEGGEQPHAHIMYSERLRDGIERDPEQYFRRYNSKDPERGGCQKASGGKTHAERQAELVGLRERWADLQNAHLAQHGHAARVDHRTLEAQGIERSPEQHLGGQGVRKLDAQQVSALLEYRAAEGERERAQREASGLIDLSGDLAAAKAKRAELAQAASPAPSAEPEKTGFLARIKSAFTRPQAEPAAPVVSDDERRQKAEALRLAAIEKAKAEAVQNEERAKAAKDAASRNQYDRPAPQPVAPVKNEAPPRPVEPVKQAAAPKPEAKPRAEAKPAEPDWKGMEAELKKQPQAVQLAVYKRFLDRMKPEEIAQKLPELAQRVQAAAKPQEQAKPKAPTIQPPTPKKTNDRDR